MLRPRPRRAFDDARIGEGRRKDFTDHAEFGDEHRCPRVEALEQLGREHLGAETRAVVDIEVPDARLLILLEQAGGVQREIRALRVPADVIREPGLETPEKC